MGEKDISEKILEDFNDVFADIANTLIFGGSERIRPNELEDTQTRSHYKCESGKLHEQERDTYKIWTRNRMRIGLFGYENQTGACRLLPVRVIGYDGASYRSQLGRKRISPVVTIVLNFGNRRWTGPTSLKDILSIPNGLDDYVNDWKVHVFDIAWLPDETVNLFRSDFRAVAKFFVNRRRNKNYIPDDDTELQHVDAVLKLLSVMTGDTRYDTIIEKKGKKVKNMCEVADRLVNMGKEEGREKREGISGIVKMGRKFHASDAEIIDMIMNEIHMTREEAMKSMQRVATTS